VERRLSEAVAHRGSLKHCGLFTSIPRLPLAYRESVSRDYWRPEPAPPKCGNRAGRFDQEAGRDGRAGRQGLARTAAILRAAAQLCVARVEVSRSARFPTKNARRDAGAFKDKKLATHAVHCCSLRLSLKIRKRGCGDLFQNESWLSMRPFPYVPRRPCG
jgi:hypothetical protein